MKKKTIIIIPIILIVIILISSILFLYTSKDKLKLKSIGYNNLETN